MSTVNDAVEAGARAMSEHWRDMHAGESLGRQRALARRAARAMWPVLSAGLRELHRQKINFRPRRLDGGAHLREECQHCGPRVAWPCATVRELDRIDKELGL